MRIDPGLERLQRLIEQKRIQSALPQEHRISVDKRFPELTPYRPKGLLPAAVDSRQSISKQNESMRIDRGEEIVRVNNTKLVNRDLLFNHDDIKINMGESVKDISRGESHLGQYLDIYA